VTINQESQQQGDEIATMARLELRREPFSPVNDEDFFYAETLRAKCLKFLLHLAPYSDALLLTGGRGSGKTSRSLPSLAPPGESVR